MAYWLFKTEPSEYCYADLVRDKHAVWEGVSNATALIHLRAVAKGDTVVVYHTGADKAVIGLAQVTKGPYPDPKLGEPKRVVVDLKPMRAFASPLPLSEFRTDPVLKSTELVRNSRLSVMPLTPEHFARLIARTGGNP